MKSKTRLVMNKTFKTLHLKFNFKNINIMWVGGWVGEWLWMFGGFFPPTLLIN